MADKNREILPEYKDVHDRWMSARSLRQKYDHLWEICLRKFAGQHWMYYDVDTGQVSPYEPQSRNYPLHRTNLIRRDVEVLKWILLSPLPRPTGRPAPGHGQLEEKLLLSQYLSGLMQQWWEHFGHDEIYEDVALSLLILGNAYQRPYWNPKDEKSLVDVPAAMEDVEKSVDTPVVVCDNCGQRSEARDDNPAQKCPVCQAPPPMARVEIEPRTKIVKEIPKDEQGQILMRPRPAGEVSVEYVPAHELYWPRRARNINQAGYMFRLRYMSPAWIKAQTGVTVEAESTLANRMFDWQINGITGHPMEFGGGEDSGTELNDVSPYLEYLERPNPVHPDGMHLIWADTEAKGPPIKVKEYPDTRLPFGLVHDRFRIIPNRFHGAGIVEDIYPVNNQFNSEVSQMDYMRTRYLHAKIITFRGSGVNESKISGSNDVVPCNDPQLTPKTLPIITPIPQLLQGMGMTLQRHRDLSMVESPMLGQQPGSTRANQAIQFLSQSAKEPILGIKRRMLRNMQRVYEELLRLGQKNYNEEREFEVMGSGHEYEFRRFQTADLKKPGVIIRVDLDNIYPVSKEADREALQGFMQYMPNVAQQLAMQDPSFLQAVLDNVGMPREKYNVEYNMHTKAAQVEMREFLESGGQSILAVEPMLDIHPFHVQVHTRFLYSDEGRALRQSSDPAQQQLYQAIVQHIAQHRQIMAAQAQQAAGQQQQPPPPPGA